MHSFVLGFQNCKGRISLVDPDQGGAWRPVVEQSALQVEILDTPRSYYGIRCSNIMKRTFTYLKNISMRKYRIKIVLSVNFYFPTSFIHRIGASGLLTDIERQLFHWVTGRYAAAHELAMS